MLNKTITPLLIFVFAILIFTSALPALAKLSFSQVENTGGDDSYTFSGSETFSGFLEYDDCLSTDSENPSDPALIRTGCPLGYNFIIQDEAEINKIPLTETSFNTADFCSDDQCELFIMLDDKPAYGEKENAELSDLLKAGSNKKVQLTLTDLSIGPYSAARFVATYNGTPSSLPESGPLLAIILFMAGMGAMFYFGKRKKCCSTK